MTAYDLTHPLWRTAWRVGSTRWSTEGPLCRTCLDNFSITAVTPKVKL